jgi:hypothetical protein
VVAIRKWVLGSLAVLAIFILGQRILPPLVASSLRDVIEKSAISIGEIDVSVRVIHFYKLLFGSVDRLVIEANDYSTDQVTIKKLNLAIDGLKYDPSKLLFSKVFEVTSLDRGVGSFTVTEKVLNDYFIHKVGNSDLIRLKLIDNCCYIKGNLRTAGIEFELSLGGSFKVTGDHSVAYVPKEFSVQKTVIPESIIDQIAG